MSENQKGVEPGVRAKHQRKHVAGLVLPFLARDLFFMLSPAEWFVWCAIFLHSDRAGRCYLLNATLAAETNLSLGTVQAAKRGLVDKYWLVRCGQKNGRGSNIYEVGIPIPKRLDDFIGALWERLNAEQWWERLRSHEETRHSEQHLDWMIAWRAIRVIRENDSNSKNHKTRWMPDEKLDEELHGIAIEAMLTHLRAAGRNLGQSRGLWWLFGDGFDEASKESA